MTKVNIFTIKSIYIAVAIPINDKDGKLVKVNEKKESRWETKYNGYRNKVRVRTLPNNIVQVTLSLSHRLEKRLRRAMNFQNDSKQFLLLRRRNHFIHRHSKITVTSK